MSLLVIVPSRGRPGRLADMLAACDATISPGTVITVTTDDDDPELPGYRDLLAGPPYPWLTWRTGPRRTLAGWTNEVAAGAIRHFDFIGSFGDDHLPRTACWDIVLTSAIRNMGGMGIAYPDDRRRDDIPEAVVMSAGVVSVLGWMIPPGIGHFYCDNAWADLGREAGCIRYCPEAVIEHAHYTLRPDVARDATYADAEAGADADRAAYERWRLEHLAADAALISALRRQPP